MVQWRLLAILKVIFFPPPFNHPLPPQEEDLPLPPHLGDWGTDRGSFLRNLKPGQILRKPRLFFHSTVARVGSTGWIIQPKGKSPISQYLAESSNSCYLKLDLSGTGKSLRRHGTKKQNQKHKTCPFKHWGPNLWGSLMYKATLYNVNFLPVNEDTCVI